MDPSLQALRKQVEKETAQGHSWDTVVQLRMIQELIEVSSQVALLNKVLSEILSESKQVKEDLKDDGRPYAQDPYRNEYSAASAPSPSPAKRGRGRPSGKGNSEV